MAVMVMAYILTALIGIPVVHRRIRMEAQDYFRRVPDVEPVVWFHYTLPILPGVIVCSYDIGNHNAFGDKGEFKAFLLVLFYPRQIYMRRLWES